jgi:hypothetical protein
MRYILTFDIGTTAVKACLFDEGLRLAACSNEEYALLTGDDGTIELEPEKYWEAVKAGALSAIQKAGIDAANIAAVSVTTQGETLIPVDAQGNALRNAIVWLDQRAGKEAEELAQMYPADVFYRKTGLPELNGYTPVAKVMWIRRHEPEIYEKTDCFLLLEIKFHGGFVVRYFAPSQADKFLVGGIDCRVQSGWNGDRGMASRLTGELGLCKIGLINRVREHSTEVVQTSFPFSLHFNSSSTRACKSIHN